MELSFDDNITVRYRDKSYIASNLNIVDKYQLYILRKVLRSDPAIENLKIIFPDKTDLTITSLQIKAFLAKPILTKPIRETFATLKIVEPPNLSFLLIIGLILLLLSLALLFWKNVRRWK